MSDKPKRIAVYFRVSSKRQEDEMQEIDVRKYADLYKYDIVAVYREKKSAVFGIRPEYDLMMGGALSGQYDGILVWKIDRLSRNHEEFCGIARRLMETNVALISVHEHIDMTTATGRFFVKMQSLIAELEAETLKLRTNRGRQLAKERGQRFGKKRRHDYRAVVESYDRTKNMQATADEMGLTKGAVSKIVRIYKEEDNQRLAIVQ